MPQVINNLDLKKNEIQNVVLQPLSTPPSDPKLGQKYFNTNDKNEYRWNGTAWVTYQAPLSTTAASTISIPNGIVKGDGSTLTAATAGTDYQAPLPSQTGNSGKYLTTNGSVLSWASPPGAPVTSVNTKTGDVTLTAADVGAATSSDISTAINALDGSITGTAGAGKTLTAFSQTNGKVTATFGDIVFPVTSVNTKTGAVSLTASDVGALPDTIEIPTATSDLTNDSNFVSDASYVHTDNNFTTTLKNKLDGIAAGATVDDHKWSDVTLNKSSLLSVGSVYVPYLSATTSTSSNLILANSTPSAYELAKYDKDAFLNSTTPAVDDSSTKVATTAFVSNAISSLGSVLDFKGTKETASQLPATGNKTGDVWIITADNSEYVWTGTVWEKFGPTIDLSGYVPTSRTVNGKALSTDISLTAADVGAATPSQIPTVTVSPTLTSGEEVGTITIDGTTTTLYAPEDTDTKVNQTKVTYSSYTYWRAIPFGTYNASTPIAALSATNTTDREYTVDNLRFWPQYGWLRTHAFNPAPNAAGTTNSYNNMTSDSISNIYFRINATTYNSGDTVLTLYSNGTDMQVRPGGQYHDKVDLGKNTTRWKNLYLTDNVYLGTGDIRFEDNVYGYYKSADGKFYENYSNSTYSDVITGQTGKRYIDRNSTNTYYWNGSSYTTISNDDFYGTKISNPNHTQLNLDGYNTLGTHSDVTVRGVATPTNNNDAVNKAYVDSAISGISFPTNCEVTVTHIVGTWGVNTTYATMVAAHNAGGIVYFTYGSYTAIASFHTSNTVTANIMYMDSEGIYQIQITVNSSDEVNCTETNYTFPTIYNGETS